MHPEHRGVCAPKRGGELAGEEGVGSTSWREAETEIVSRVVVLVLSFPP